MRYTYECSNRHSVYIEVHPDSRKPGWKKCPECKQKAHRVFGFQTSPNCGVFQSYVEKDLPGGTVEITSAAQRDRLCQEHNVTYDSYSNLDRIRGKESCADQITFDEAMTQNKKDNGEWL